MQTDLAADAELVDSGPIADDPAALRARLAESGYLFVRSALPPAAVLEARRALLERLRDAGGLERSAALDEAIGNGAAHLYAMDQPTRWWIGLTSTPVYRALCHHPGLRALMRVLLDEEPRALAYYALRLTPPGGRTPAHCDRRYFRGTAAALTAWVPLGDVPRRLGGLRVLERSHRDAEVAAYADGVGDVTFSGDADAVARRYGRRWRSTDFAAGDVLVFGMSMWHECLPNADAHGRLRVTTDIRWQRWSEAIDPRFAGDGSPSQACDFAHAGRGDAR